MGFNFCGVFTKLKPTYYPKRKCQITNHIFRLQTHFAWSHHICLIVPTKSYTDQRSHFGNDRVTRKLTNKAILDKLTNWSDFNVWMFYFEPDQFVTDGHFPKLDKLKGCKKCLQEWRVIIVNLSTSPLV